MKHIATVLLLVSLVVGVSRGQDPTVQAGIFPDGATNIVVKAKPVGADLVGTFSAITVTIYWETSSGVSVGSISSPYGITASSTGEDGIFTYQMFSMVAVPGYALNWGQGTENTVLTVTFTGSASTFFMLKNPPAAANGDWYFEAKAADLTDYGTPFYVSQAEIALPVTLTSFMGKVNASKGGVVLEWKTASEVNNYGYTVQRKGENEADFSDLSGAFVAGKGTTLDPQQYSYVDKSITGAGSYAYRLKQQDMDGTIHYTQSVIVQVTLTDVAEVAPKMFQLMQNYPNPFNPSTQVKFSVESTTRATVKVYNMLGEEVSTLFDGTAEAGRFYVSTFNATSLASGVYFYRLTTQEKTDVRRMMLVR